MKKIINIKFEIIINTKFKIINIKFEIIIIENIINIKFEKKITTINIKLKIEKIIKYELFINYYYFSYLY